MAFNVGDPVIAQKLGGQSGNKNISPEFHGKVRAVMGGGNYRIDFSGHIRQESLVFFKDNIVNESELTAG